MSTSAIFTLVHNLPIEPNFDPHNHKKGLSVTMSGQIFEHIWQLHARLNVLAAGAEHPPFNFVDFVSMNGAFLRVSPNPTRKYTQNSRRQSQSESTLRMFLKYHISLGLSFHRHFAWINFDRNLLKGLSRLSGVRNELAQPNHGVWKEAGIVYDKPIFLHYQLGLR
jgi:hypothetical protein